MANPDLLTPRLVTVPSAGSAVVADAEFDIRWAASIARGRVHDQRVRRRFLLLASVIGIGAAIAFAPFR